MIFVSVGTTGFDDLIKQIDRIAAHSEEEFVAQIGPGGYEPVHCEYFRYQPTINDYYHRAEIVISHGGLATVTEVLRRGKPLVSVEDRKQPDRHQQQILSLWSELNYLLWCQDLRDLEDCINHARNITFESYIAAECKIQDIVMCYIDSL